MPELHPYRLFISHAWSYNEEYYRLQRLLNEAPNFDWRNYSVPEHDPVDAGNNLKLQQALRNQIGPVELVVILAGMYANHSQWIQFEINYAQALTKRILGVRPWGSERIPQVVQDGSHQLVGWNTDSIVSAIRTLTGR